MELYGQKLLVHEFGESGEEIASEKYQLGEMVVIAHKKEGKAVHYFEGKITGIFKNRSVIRVFDYARSTRVVSVAGKKINVNEIVGIQRMDAGEFRKRENKAVAASAAGAIGAAIGGKAGYGILAGSTVAGIGSDIVSRERVSQQRIKCEIVDY